MDAVKWPVSPLLWRRGFQTQSGFETWITLCGNPERNYEHRFANLEYVWKEYSAAGEPGEDWQKRLGEFMRQYGAPITAAPGLEPEHWKNPTLKPAELAPEESMRQIIVESRNAYVCNEMLVAANRGWVTRLQEPVSLCLDTEYPEQVDRYDPPAYTGRTSEYKRKLQNAAYSFVRKVAAHYVPELSVQVLQSGDERIFGHTLPGLRPALWLSFLTSIPGTVVPEEWLTCRDYGKYKGCGQPFQSDQPNTLYCPDCKRRINTEKTRAKRAKARRRAASEMVEMVGED